MNERFKKEQTLKSLMHDMLRKGGMEQRYTELDIISHYKEIMGPAIANRTTEIRMRNKTLVIRLNSGVLKEELSHNKSKIAALINDKLGFQFIEEVEIW